MKVKENAETGRCVPTTIFFGHFQEIPKQFLIEFFEKRLEKLQKDHPIGSKGFTKAGIRKMIARLHEELAVYEGNETKHAST